MADIGTEEETVEVVPVETPVEAPSTPAPVQEPVPAGV